MTAGILFFLAGYFFARVGTTAVRRGQRGGEVLMIQLAGWLMMLTGTACIVESLLL